MLDELKNILKGRIVIVGIGNILRGDDGVGPYIAEELIRKIKNENVLVLNCEEVPESYTDKIVNFAPSVILIIDAVEINKEPGTVAIIKQNELKGKTLTTHTISLKVFIDYIKSRTNAEVFVLGIQQQNIEFGMQQLSLEVKTSADMVVDFICSIVSEI